MSKIHGRATIRINGQVYETEDDATLVVGGLKNTPKMVGNKSYYTQTTIPSKVTGKIPVTEAVNLRTLQELAEVEITFESDTGVTYHIPSAHQENELELKGGEGGGTVEVSFGGDPAEKI